MDEILKLEVFQENRHSDASESVWFYFFFVRAYLKMANIKEMSASFQSQGEKIVLPPPSEDWKRLY